MLNVKDLVAGDRVILHCPTAANTPRPARYDGLFRSLQDAMVQKDAILLTGAPAEFLASTGVWAGFTLQRGTSFEGSIPLAVDSDGSLHDQEGKTLFIEERMQPPRVVKVGDLVRIHPHGKPDQGEQAKVALVVFGNETCIALEFPEVPIFCKRGLDTGGAGGINQENSRVTMLLMRVYGVDGVRLGPWIELTGHGHYEIE